MTMKIPENFVCYKKTPVFDQDTVPARILTEHNTKAGVWGHLVVVAGEIEYVDLEESRTTLATPQHAVVIAPQRKHHLRLLGPVTFFVEFYQAG